jgi:hypothetical protein
MKLDLWEHQMEAIYSHVPTLTEINGTGYIIQRNIAHAL